MVSKEKRANIGNVKVSEEEMGETKVQITHGPPLLQGSESYVLIATERTTANDHNINETREVKNRVNVRGKRTGGASWRSCNFFVILLRPLLL